MLHLKTAIERNQLIVTDGDEKEYNAFISVTGNDKIFTQSRHGLCSFHLIDHGFKDNGIMGSNLGREGKAYLEVIKCWLSLGLAALKQMMSLICPISCSMNGNTPRMFQKV